MFWLFMTFFFPAASIDNSTLYTMSSKMKRNSVNVNLSTGRSLKLDLRSMPLIRVVMMSGSSERNKSLGQSVETHRFDLYCSSLDWRDAYIWQNCVIVLSCVLAFGLLHSLCRRWPHWFFSFLRFDEWLNEFDIQILICKVYSWRTVVKARDFGKHF